MGANSELFLRMTEQEYFNIPEEIRERHLRSKIVSEEKGDWSENMKDKTFSDLSLTIKETKKHLAEREFQLREERRNINNK
jgi:hypothetical protein